MNDEGNSELSESEAEALEDLDVSFLTSLDAKKLSKKDQRYLRVLLA